MILRVRLSTTVLLCPDQLNFNNHQITDCFQVTFCKKYLYVMDRGLYIDGSMCGLMPVEFNCHTMGINNMYLVVGDLGMYGLAPGPAASNMTEANCPTLGLGDLSSASCPTLVVQDFNTTLGVGRRPSAAWPTLVV